MKISLDDTSTRYIHSIYLQYVSNNKLYLQYLPESDIHRVYLGFFISSHCPLLSLIFFFFAKCIINVFSRISYMYIYILVHNKNNQSISKYNYFSVVQQLFSCMHYLPLYFENTNKIKIDKNRLFLYWAFMYLAFALYMLSSGYAYAYSSAIL